MDANANRAREGARVTEEFCRFIINNAFLTVRAKTLRHRLCAILNRIPSDRLICARDSAGDVGREVQVPGQMVRTEAMDSFIAAVRRLTEALRVLTEIAQVLHPSLAGELEHLRFEAYTLEKDIFLYADPSQRFRNVRLYVILTVSPDISDAWVTDTAEKCCHGGADCLQLRPKGLSDDRCYRLACDLARIGSEHNVITIMNDRVDIAIAANMDGLHLGQNDLPMDPIRRLLHKPMILGLSTHNPPQLEDAIAANPTYIALGPAFATATKPVEPVAGLDYIRESVRRTDQAGLSHVAIGGIESNNLDQILSVGVRCIAVCSAITACKDAQNACVVLKKKMTNSGDL